MEERLLAVEDLLGWDNTFSRRYAPIVHAADTLRMIYASHCVRPRRETLPLLKEKLLDLKESEWRILSEFTEKCEGIGGENG